MNIIDDIFVDTINMYAMKTCGCTLPLWIRTNSPGFNSFNRFTIVLLNKMGLTDQGQFVYSCDNTCQR